MFRRLLKSKIHRARVTEANLDYEGSITIPKELLLASNILVHEAVHVWNVTSGTRFETYAIEGEAYSGEICVNGAAAHLVTLNDIIIIASFIHVSEEYCLQHEPSVVFVNVNNAIVEKRLEVASRAADLITGNV